MGTSHFIRNFRLNFDFWTDKTRPIDYNFYCIQTFLFAFWWFVPLSFYPHNYFTTFPTPRGAFTIQFRSLFTCSFTWAETSFKWKIAHEGLTSIDVEENVFFTALARVSTVLKIPFFGVYPKIQQELRPNTEYRLIILINSWAQPTSFNHQYVVFHLHFEYRRQQLSTEVHFSYVVLAFPSRFTQVAAINAVTVVIN